MNNNKNKIIYAVLITCYFLFVGHAAAELTPTINKIWLGLWYGMISIIAFVEVHSSAKQPVVAKPECVPVVAKPECPDCGGTGTWIGLMTKEPCSACAGWRKSLPEAL